MDKLWVLHGIFRDLLFRLLGGNMLGKQYRKQSDSPGYVSRLGPHKQNIVSNALPITRGAKQLNYQNI